MKRTSIIISMLCLALASRAQVEPLIHTTWSQTSPYNDQCPDNMLAGCVAIAMAQVMNFHKYPQHGQGSNSYTWKGKKLTANFGETYYRWDEMETDGEAVAELVYHCGVSVWMDYSSSFSGSNEYYAKSALVDFFGYDEDIKLMPRNKYTDEEWSDILRQQLDEGLPMIYSSGGHTFVVDGYNSDGLFHANMGFGYPGRYYTLDELGGKSNSTAVINIRPTDSFIPSLIAFTPNGNTQIPLPIHHLLTEQL
ncbi:MAG: C10 family peptidase [Bacteroidales bacterium]|nr:C10 family peptidase [Bacteroidales bacterium]